MLAAGGRFEDVTGPMSAGGARLLWHLCHGVAPFRDGRAGLEAMLREKTTTFGGALDERRLARALEVRRRRCEAVVADDGSRYGAQVVVFADDPLLLEELWEEAPPEGVSRGYAMQVAAPVEERPLGLQDPCGWIAPDGRACLVRVTDQALSIRWAGGQSPPDVRALVPLGSLEPEEPRPIALPDATSTDALGLSRHPLRGSLRNLLHIGPSTTGGLGLEGEFISAWQGASRAERLCGRRRR